MSSNGGTLHGVPHPPGTLHNNNCNHCGLLFDSAASLQVHMHYHHEKMNRWGPPPTSTVLPTGSTSSTASNSPTDSDNNNQPSNKYLLSSKSNSPSQQNTIAAADSSDNQPPTPTPQTGNGISSGSGESNTPQNYSGTASPYHSHQQHQQNSAPPSAAEIHYPPYIHSYEQYYHPHHSMDYGIPPSHHLNNQLSQQQQQEYKPVPSTRYHPYINNNNQQQSQPSPLHNPNNSSLSVNNSALSPRVVSSSSPTQNSIMQNPNTTITGGVIQVPPGQPTPSPSPKQCDKCGLVCESAGQLSEHCATAHAGSRQNNGSGTASNRSGEETEMQNFQFTPYIKEEPPSDILDLDSQKMVYSMHNEPLSETPLPPMHSLHGLQAMQRPPMLWGHDPGHGFLPPPHHQQEIKSPYYPSIKQEYTPPAIKSDYQSSNIKQESYSHHIPQMVTSQHQDLKSFTTDVSSVNQVTTSPQDFPTTTTPQDNGSQFRSFEPPTSSLPNNSAPVKSTTWKSNEARRPKTYNCTACNKWFTSSGHLKRHYNTTLHKNAVKSSGQPDPATLPISAHHHPSRDPNSKHHRANAQSAQAPQPPAPPPDPPRSPEYTPQYTPPSGFGPPQAMPPQGFQQYGTALHTTAGGPPNGQAGPSVLASQPRGLLIYSNNMATQPMHQEQRQTHIITSMQPTSTINTTGPYNIISPIVINTNTTQSFPAIQLPEALQQNYHTIIGNASNCDIDGDDAPGGLVQIMPTSENQEMGSTLRYPMDGIKMTTTIPAASILSRLSGGAAAYQGDTAPPFSPDIPETYLSTSSAGHRDCRSPTPQMGATAPSSPAPCSPSVTSSGTQNANPTTEPHRCVQCDKVFNKACYLTQHNKTFHSGDKPYKCQRCGKRFPCDQSHEHHVSKHAGEKPFKCELCPKQFNHKTDLRRHMCLHSGTKPFTCETCGKGFIRKDHMMKHCETHMRRSALNNLTKPKSQKQNDINANSNLNSNINNKSNNNNSNKNVKKQKQLNNVITSSTHQDTNSSDSYQENTTLYNTI